MREKFLRTPLPVASSLEAHTCREVSDFLTLRIGRFKGTVEKNPFALEHTLNSPSLEKIKRSVAELTCYVVRSLPLWLG